jgi:hypothetical protein
MRCATSEQFGRSWHKVTAELVAISIAIEATTDTGQSDANDDVDGAHSTAWMCQKVANHYEGSRPWARLARLDWILRSQCPRFTV